MDKVPPAEALEEALLQITAKPKRSYTQEEIDQARGELALMNDRVFLAHFIDNKNNHVIKGLADAVRKIHALPPIPQVQRTVVQNVSLLDVLGRGMIGDLQGWGEALNIALEIQKGKQEGYAVRGTLTSSNVMRTGFNASDDFTEAPDVIGINILGFKLPQLAHRTMFVSRIVRAEYDSKVPFLDDKYSDYYIEMPKMHGVKKAELPEVYHDLWDLCCIFKAKVKNLKEVIKMQAVQNPIALDLAEGVTKTVARNEVVHETLDRRGEILELARFVERKLQKEAEKIVEKANKKEEKAVKTAKANGMEEMLVAAIQSNAPADVITSMQKNAGISNKRLAVLRTQAQSN